MSQIHDKDGVQGTIKRVSGSPYEKFIEYQIDDGKAFIINTPTPFLIEELQEPPFKIKVLEEGVDLPRLGFFVRYRYEILICDKLLNWFQSTRKYDREEILEEFEGTIKSWMNQELKI